MSARLNAEGWDMTEVVNLDALIPREDFAYVLEGSSHSIPDKTLASTTDLTRGEHFYSSLRKPDFQRETSAWTPERVRDFVKAYLEGDLVPAIICWMSPARLSFVIDGAHRLSAIMAWLQDDYGDGAMSKAFYGGNIPPKQKRIAEKTRKLVDQSVEPYRDYKAAISSPGLYPQLVERARMLGVAGVKIQWVPHNSAAKAEQAFRTINRSSVSIDPTELRILQARLGAPAITARAIVKNGGGHEYWAKFDSEIKTEFVKIAKDVYELLYRPEIDDDGMRSADLPVAGPGYGTQSLPLLFEVVNVANGNPIIDKTKGDPDNNVTPSATGEQALNTIRNTVGLVRRMAGMHASSLGLHPAIYFYSASGRHQPTALLAFAGLVDDLAREGRLNQFCEFRKPFEDFLIGHKEYVNQLTSKFGSIAKGYKRQKGYFSFVLDALISGKTVEEVDAMLAQHSVYFFLKKEVREGSEKAKDFSSAFRRYKFLSSELETARVCTICSGKLDPKAMSLDHQKEQHLGGAASDSNAGWSHLYCNTTYKRVKA